MANPFAEQEAWELEQMKRTKLKVRTKKSFIRAMSHLTFYQKLVSALNERTKVRTGWECQTRLRSI